MKTLSIRQPWAWLICHAGKDIENREWSSPYRGEIFIHASKTMTRGDYEACQIFIAGFGPEIPLPPFHDLPRGGIVGSCHVIACVTADDSPWFCGPFGLVLRRVNPLPFQEYPGRLKFFDVPAAEYYIPAATKLGWSPTNIPTADSCCDHRNTDGRLNCPDCGIPVAEFLEDAQRFLLSQTSPLP
jgi:hypothetical protein